MARVGFLALILSVVALLMPAEAQADVISKNNPYRSFNVSGVNYGSMRWEQQHKRSQKVWAQPVRRGARWRR